MKTRWIYVLLLTLAVVVASCAPAMQTDNMEQQEQVMQKEVMQDDSMEKSEEAMQKKSTYQGEVLAGSTSKYIAFTKEDYDKAVAQDKIVLLYFYASWCPSCQAEQPEVHAAFNELTRDDVVGFRVNYRDSDTDNYEEALAKEHGVAYQHTKVIIKNGERVLKAPNSWKKENYLTELGKVQ